jgi:ABC-2 type transport system permease protein
MTDALRPYLAAFAARFQVMLQYRAAALAGFVTQAWWGALKVMVYAAFYRHAVHTDAPMSLAQAITYTWLGQALLTLQPWTGDPDVSAAVRTGGVSYDCLRPVDTYNWWLVRATAWMTARAVPRAALMFAAAGVALPLMGYREWAWQAPADLTQGALFVCALLLMILLSAAFTMLINICIAATLTDRGINTLAAAFVILFSGNLIPLGFFPDWAQPALIAQPFAGMLDIPMRIYIGTLRGSWAYAGLAMQAFWLATFVLLGRLWMGRVMMRLEVQGG